MGVVGVDQSWLKNEVKIREYNNCINTVLWECIPLLYSRCYNYKAKLTLHFPLQTGWHVLTRKALTNNSHLRVFVLYTLA